MDKRAAEAIEYLDSLIADQTDVMLKGGGKAGQITRIEEYRAGVMLLRSIWRLRGKIVEIFSKDEPDDGE